MSKKINSLRNLKPCDECEISKRRSKLLLIARYKEENSYFHIMPLDIFKIIFSYIYTANHIIQVRTFNNSPVPPDYLDECLFNVPCSANIKYLKNIFAQKWSLPPSGVDAWISEDRYLIYGHKLHDKFQLIKNVNNTFYLKFNSKVIK